MPLYTDSNYYYSGGSSQLYSPYYPGSTSAAPTSSGLYSPYTSTYNRPIGGSYVVPISTSRSSNYSSPHSLSSRYQPKLSTITETSSPLMGASRHTTLIPLTRINSPKYTSYSSASAVHAPKYTPPRPILINTADIDVSANRYRQRKEETLRQAQRATDYTSPQSSLKRKNSVEIKVEPQEVETKKQVQEPTKESSPEQHVNRSTIRRNRAVVRLSTIRSRSKDRNANKLKDEEVPEKKFKDLPKYEPPEDVPFKWREKLADDLAQIPTYPNKKTPGDVLREKYLIQDNKNDENYAAQCRAERLAAGLPKESMEEVIVEIDPLHHTVRRLSIPQCPTFHDICEDISSDKIDDDLNAGALRRRASIIQNQEQEILNELQKSASGTFQMITLERRDSHDSVDLEMPTAHKRHSKRSSKKGKKLRTKITAIVDIENAPVLTTVIPETPEEFDPGKSPKPKFTVNVESVEEHHEIHKVFKLPKKKSIKKIAKVKEQVLPEGFMTPLPKPQVSPKKKFIKPTAEVFTFDEQVKSETVNDQKPILQASQSLDEGKKPAQAKVLEKANSINVELKTPTTPKIVESKTEMMPLSPKTTTELLKDEKKTLQTSMSVDSASKTLEKVEMELSTPVKNQESGPLASTSTTELSKAEKKTDSPKTLKTSMSVDSATKTATSKILEKSNSVNVEMKTPPATPKTPLNKKETVFSAPKSTPEEQKSSPKTLANSSKTMEQSPLAGENLEEKKVLKTSQSLDNEPKPSLGRTLQKSSSINVELKTPTTPSTPTLLKEIIEESTQETQEIKSLADTIKIDSKSSYVAEKLEDKKILKSSQSLDNEPKLGMGKTLQKSNSINVELKTPKTPTTPTKVLIKETMKEESQATEKVKPLIAKPKPIQKAIMKSDSGEDFWAQIGSRETMYMNKRKKDIVEKQWQKREDLLEATGEENVKNIEEIKTKVTSQKIEALKKAEQDKQNSKGVVSRSNSNESALKKKSPVKGKEENKATENEKSDDKPKTPVTLKDLKSGDVKIKPNDKLENAKTPVVTKMSKETSLSPSTTTTITSPNTSSPTVKTATKTTIPATSNTTTPPKIVGQQAKSPEQQEQAEQNNCYPTTQAKSNNNKNEMDINKMAKTNTENNAKEQLAKTFTLPKENTTITAAKAKAKADDETSTTAPNVAESTTTKQAETKQINKTTELQNKNNAVTKTKTNDNGNKPLAAVAAAKSKTDKESPTTKSKPKTSPNAINADQFIAKAPAKTIATSAITGTTTTTTAASASAANATSPKNAPTITKTTNKTAAATTTTVAAATNAIGTATAATPADNKDKCKTNDNSNNTDNNNNNDNTTDTGGSNLSKFATVLNLAQCLQDVDAELADYLPSSAEISENEDYSDSDFDYSSIDGWDKLTPSMKKKIKQRHRKEKQAEQARFDPQKKVKIDTTRKLYVKEEAPRFPLVATPRPLWKREKIVYPVDDSDDESDSEESGSTEETEDSDECTTSEEYEDEVNPIASGDGGGKSGDGKNGSSTDPNKENPSIIRMSTCSNDSGFEGGTAPASPKKMLETSYTYSQFQKSGRFTPPATIIPRFKNYSVDDFHFLAVLGKGSFGKVLLAELRDTTYYYAVKCLKKDVVLEDDDVDSTLIERKVLALGTKHPYLCHLFCTFQTESHLFFVMEYLNGGDLMFHIQESGRFTEERARFYGAEIVSGLKFLHKKGIIYRDLKLDNVLLDYEGHVRIADFGMCKLQIYLDKTADSFCGTPDYMAPEIIKGDKYNQNVDWWSFGVLLYEMLIGQSPFSGCDEDELFWSICNELPWFPVYISAEATSILKGLLEKDHAKRIGSHYSPAGDIVEHIFFRPIDWNLLEKRQIEPPFRPQVKHPLDTQYFDRVFTKERVRLTPIDKDILQSMDQKQFLGFTYTNPHITLD